MSGPRHTVRRERGRLDAGWLRARFSFSFGDYVHPQGGRYGPVLALNEDLVAPGTGFPMHPHRDLEIFMIPRSGAIAHADSLGGTHTVRTGQVLMLRAGTGIAHSQFNASEREVDHHLQLWIEPAQRGLPPHATLRDVGPVPCGTWHPLAAPPGVQATFALAQDARVLLGAACPQAGLLLPLPAHHAAWLHLVEGQARVRLPHAQELLQHGESVEIDAGAGPVRLEAVGQRADWLAVLFPASQLRR